MAIIHFDTSKLPPGMKHFINDKKAEFASDKGRHVSGHNTIEYLLKAAYDKEIGEYAKKLKAKK